MPSIRAILVGIAAALSVPMATSANAAPLIGRAAPDFTIAAADGSTVSLSQFAGKTVIIEWLNDSCAFVQKHYDSRSMQALQRKANGYDTIWLSVMSPAVSGEQDITAASAQQWQEARRAAPAFVLLDTTGSLAERYSVKVMPQFFVIDGDGVLRYSGAIDSVPSSDPEDIARADNYVDEAMLALHQGRSLVIQQSQPYGCPVKRAN